MARFKIRGITLRVPDEALSEGLREILSSKAYEQAEARTLRKLLRFGDRVLDLGSGTGYTAIVAGRKIGPENVVAVEANPAMMPALRRNLDANGAEATQAIHGAVVSDGFDEDSLLFNPSDAFWAGRIAPATSDPQRVVEVPALKLSALFAAHRPTVVSMDVEGAERHLCRDPWPAHVRLVVLELHSRVYGLAGVKDVLDGMSANDITLKPGDTTGEVIVLQRVG